MPEKFSIKLPEFLHEQDGEFRVVGHRITLYHILTEYNRGHSPEQIALQFPTLKLATIHKIIGFYLDQQPEIDAYLSAYRATLDHQATQAASGPTKAELLRRLEEIRLKAHHAAHVSH